MSDVVIGSGFAGLAASDRLVKAGRDVRVLESRPYWGGHTHTRDFDGFLFDEGPHVSFTSDEEVISQFKAGVSGLEEFQARITNYFRGAWITHPAQVHLHGLDPDLVAQCIVDFVAAQADPPRIDTYADWLRAMYGETFAEMFPFAYTRKYWTVEPDHLGTDWVGDRMYPPTLNEVVMGALKPQQEGEFHYLKWFRYPSSGGYQSFMNAMVDTEIIELGMEVVAIEPGDKRLRLSDGSEVAYENLVSTMPLPALVAAVAEAPTEVRAAAERLLCTSVVLVDVAVDRHDLSEHHWLYVYDEDISFSRVHFPHMLSPGNAPSGKGSIQCEVYYSSHRPLTHPIGVIGDRVVDELVEMGILESRAEVLFTKTRDVRFANVVFDHHRQPALDVILPWVESQGIVLAGRFGEWGYHWTDDATRSGWAAADRILGKNDP